MKYQISYGTEAFLRLRLTGLSFLFLIFSVSCSHPSLEVRDSLKAFKSHLDTNVTQLMEQYDVPGTSIALIRNGELVWSGAYGYAEVAQDKKMTVDAICRAESISKSVTAWGVMRLVEQNLLDLDTPVQNYLNDWELPESKYTEQEVTIRRLLSNSAGMPLGTLGEEYPPQSRMPSLRKYLDKEVQLTYEPGSAFLYSNTGYNLLELIIEEVTDRDFAEYISTELLIPLSMHNSGYAWNEKWAPVIPKGYDLEGNPVSPYVYPAKASGGLFTTVEDIARFVSAGTYSSESSVLKQQSIRTIHKPQIAATGVFSFVADFYGFGHFIETLPDGKRAVWHGGQGHGWMTHFHLIPEAGDGIVIFTNSQRSWPLIAQVLDDWSRWQGVGPVKFSRITTAVSGLKVVIGLLFLISIGLIGKIGYELRTGKRRLMLALEPITKVRLINFLIFVALTALLLWSGSQDYLFITSIFPIVTVWLGWGLLLLSLALLMSVLFPVRTKTENLITES